MAIARKHGELKTQGDSHDCTNMFKYLQDMLDNVTNLFLVHLINCLS